MCPPGERTGIETSCVRVGVVSVPLGRHPTGRDKECPRSDEQWAIRTCKRVSENLDGATIRICSALEVPREGNLVLEGEVDDAVRCLSRFAQDVEIVEAAAMHLSSGGDERGRRIIRASLPDDLMSCADELGYNGGPDPAGRAGDENTHEDLQSIKP